MATLTYDNLPVESTLMREYGVDSLKITAAAAEPGEGLRRQTAQRCAISAALISAGCIGVCLVAFGSMAAAHRNQLPWWTGGVFAVFCISMFLFIWRVSYANRLDALQRAWSGSTIIVARGRRLLIESVGPDGSISWELSPDQIRALRVLRDACRPRWGQEQPLDCLAIELSDGRSIHILRGRSPEELHWSARVLSRALEEPRT